MAQDYACLMDTLLRAPLLPGSLDTILYSVFPT